MKIDELELTFRSQNALKNAGIETIEKLITLQWGELKGIKNIGIKSAAEISWQCVSFLSGDMEKRRIDFEKKWPPRPSNWREIKEKAKKYDDIAGIVR